MSDEFPANYYKAEHVKGVGNDSFYIRGMLERITIAQRRYASAAYSKIYMSNGRSVANSRLRDYVEKCERNNHSMVSKPNAI